MVDVLTPSQFADKYLSLSVYIYPPEDGGPDNSKLAPRGWQTVSVSNYKLHLSPYRESIWNDIQSRLGVKTTVKIKTVDGAEIEDELTQNEIWQAFRQPWAGKGSPEQAQIAIQMVYRYHKASTALNAFVAANFIGLDCSGFAGNYYQRVLQGVDWKAQDNMKDPGPEAYIETLLKVGGKTALIGSLDEIDGTSAYVLAMCDSATGAVIEPDGGDVYGHVMLADPGARNVLASGRLSLTVSEATADGDSKLRARVPYTVYPARKVGGASVFKVERGSPGDTLDVRIAKFVVKG